MVTGVLLGALFLLFLLIGGGMALIWKKQRRGILRWSIILFVIVSTALLFGVGPYFAAWMICHAGTRTPDRQLKDTPADYGLTYEDIVFSARDNVRLSGWFIPPGAKNTILISSHGLFRNRIEILPRIIPLVRAGYGALLYDSRGHGTSETAVISLGYFERNDVLGAGQYLRRRYQDAPTQPRIVLMGVSMGAVATLEAAAESQDYSALILDSPFSSFRETIIDHSWLLLKMPRYTFPPLFMFWFRRFADFDPGSVNSHIAIERIQPVPLLIVASEGDRRIGPNVARALYSEARSPAKRLQIFGSDVPHGAAARLHPDRYEKMLLSFLNETLPTQQEGGDVPASGSPSMNRHQTLSIPGKAVKVSSVTEGFPR